MSASPLSFLRAGPPPPKVALLPDALFFTRTVPITTGATAAEAAAQIELALESVSPFPLAQLYYGWFWQPGAEQALVYAAYRRRFTSEQTAGWADAELVIPVSAALLGAEVAPATTVVLAAPDSLTAVHWDKPPVPTKVLARSLDPEATDEDRARVRDELLRAMDGSKTVTDLPVAPAPEPATSDREIVFRAGDFLSRLPASIAASLDVRDKGDLAALRAARRRDVMLWRVTLGCAAALLILFLGEIGLVGGKAWQKTRQLTQNARKPAVDKIMKSQELARRIDDITMNRLLPLEMVTLLVGPDTKRKPEEIQFTRISTLPNSGIYTLFIEAQTNNAALIPVYEAELNKLPEVEGTVKMTVRRSTTDRTDFDITATFKPGALKPTNPG